MVGAITRFVLLIDFRNRTRNSNLSESRGYGESRREETGVEAVLFQIASELFQPPPPALWFPLPDDPLVCAKVTDASVYFQDHPCIVLLPLQE